MYMSFDENVILLTNVSDTLKYFEGVVRRASKKIVLLRFDEVYAKRFGFTVTAFFRCSCGKGIEHRTTFVHVHANIRGMAIK